MVKEGIGPKFNIKSGTDKECADVITDSSMSAFYWTILMRRISTSWMDYIVMCSKNVEYVGISLELSTLV